MIQGWLQVLRGVDLRERGGVMLAECSFVTRGEFLVLILMLREGWRAGCLETMIISKWWRGQQRVMWFVLLTFAGGGLDKDLDCGFKD
jgi:hypothetical protein